RRTRHPVDGQIVDHDAERVLAGMQQSSHLHRVGRAPDRTGALFIDVDHCRLAYWALEPSLHARVVPMYFWHGRSFAEIEPDFEPGPNQAFGHSKGLLVGSLTREETDFIVIGPGTQAVHKDRPPCAAEGDLPSCAEIEWRRRRQIVRRSRDGLAGLAALREDLNPRSIGLQFKGHGGAAWGTREHAGRIHFSGERVPP